jgi:hypothetical protein
MNYNFEKVSKESSKRGSYRKTEALIQYHFPPEAELS